MNAEPENPSRCIPATTLGPYKLDRELSRGGVGTVYLASRHDEEFDQQVAIKVIRPGIHGKDIDRRFRAERQILAALDHPNIARLLDGGSTPEGQPYLVMELVDGVDVLEFCVTHSLSVHGRLQLFLKICSAVYYAHRHLIVHRDIKPSNILVAASGEPKLIDFGIAKLLSPQHDGTVTSAAMFSPLYASPEQLNGSAISTSTDVYSLGVVLYEMLSGSRPYRLQQTSNAELAAAILLQEPEPPSSKTPLHNDLDAIVLKALRKDPASRYASVEQLAADIGRFLDHRPVLARKGSWFYRARRFLDRNKLPLAAAALASATVAGGVTSTLIQARRAERRFQDVRQLANYLVYDVHDAVRKLPGSTDLQKEVVEISMHYLDRLAVDSGGDTELEFDIAEAYLKLGDVAGNPFQTSLRDTEQAIDSYRKAEARAAQLVENSPGDYRAQSLLVRTRIQYGGTAAYSRAGPGGIEMLRQALHVQEGLVKRNPGDVAARLTLARGKHFLSRALTQEGGFETEARAGEPIRIAEEAVRNLDDSLSVHPEHPDLLAEKAVLYARLGALFGSVDPQRSMNAYESAFAALDRVKGAPRETKAFRIRLASLHGDRGWPRAQMGQYEEGITEYGKAVLLLEKVAEEDPADSSTRAILTAMYRERGIIHGYAGHSQAAIDDYRKAADVHKDLMQRDPDHRLYAVLRGELLGRIGRIELTLGRQAQAHKDLRESLAILMDLAARPNAEANHVLEACKAMHQMPLAELKDPAKTLALCEAALKAFDGKSMFAWEAAGHARLAVDDRAGAIEAFERCLAMIEPPKAGEPKSRSQLQIEELIGKTRKGLN